jgi:hypothetical protein
MRKRLAHLGKPLRPALSRFGMSRRLDGAVHRHWRSHRAARWHALALALRIAGATLLAGGVGLAFLLHTLRWDPMWATMSVIVLAVLFAAFGAACTVYRAAYGSFVETVLDEDGAFLYCVRCGYDLRGCRTPRRRCPECGEAVHRVGARPRLRRVVRS